MISFFLAENLGDVQPCAHQHETDLEEQLRAHRRLKDGVRLGRTQQRVEQKTKSHGDQRVFQRILRDAAMAEPCGNAAVQLGNQDRGRDDEQNPDPRTVTRQRRSHRAHPKTLSNGHGIEVHPRIATNATTANPRITEPPILTQSTPPRLRISLAAFRHDSHL